MNIIIAESASVNTVVERLGIFLCNGCLFICQSMYYAMYFWDNRKEMPYCVPHELYEMRHLFSAIKVHLSESN